MQPKPPECGGCPLYGDGRGFVADEMLAGAPVLVLGQNPGADEERAGRPFVGKTGLTMVRDFFPLAGLRRGENVSLANTLRCRWNHTNDLPTPKVLGDAVAQCMAAHYRPPESTRLIVAQGSVAWKALGGPGSVTEWRGFLKPS